MIPLGVAEKPLGTTTMSLDQKLHNAVLRDRSDGEGMTLQWNDRMKRYECVLSGSPIHGWIPNSDSGHVARERSELSPARPQAGEIPFAPLPRVEESAVGVKDIKTADNAVEEEDCKAHP